MRPRTALSSALPERVRTLPNDSGRRPPCASVRAVKRATDSPSPSLSAALAFFAFALLLVGCGGEDSTEPSASLRREIDIEFPPDLPFDESEWTTTADYPPVGDARALRDQPERAFHAPFGRNSFPPTFRTDGPNSNLAELSRIHGLVFETLINIHPDTEEFLPLLASHWKIETDEQAGHQTFSFRIDENARWADGRPVTAADVYYTWWHRVQEDRSDPSNSITFGEGFEEPEILDRLTVRVRTKTLNWRLFLYFGGMLIFPAEEVFVDGETYLQEYNWKLMTGSGPYHLASPDDLVKGESITLTRRSDWWAEDEGWARNTYNFGKIRHTVIRDEELKYEKFKKAELDFFRVSRAQRWVEELPQEQIIQKGWVRQRRIHHKAPVGFAGFAFNMRKPPFDDRRVRLAFAHLFNRERLIERLFFNQYEMINSTYPGRDWGAGDTNPTIRFDPDRATELLAEAGYRERDRDGYLLGPDGQRLSVTYEYGQQSMERIWLVVKEDYETAGIEFNIAAHRLLATLMQARSLSGSSLSTSKCGPALLFPNPETSSWRSDLRRQAVQQQHHRLQE